MAARLQVASPLEKSVVLYDGQCGFCKQLVFRWHSLTEGKVVYIASQDQQVKDTWPEIPEHYFREAVQLIEPDGNVYSAAEAVFRALAKSRRFQWLQTAYEKVPGLSWFTEWGYRIVANHRSFFHRIGKLLKLT